MNLWVFLVLVILSGLAHGEEQENNVEEQLKTLREEVDQLKVTVEKLSTLLLNGRAPPAPPVTHAKAPPPPPPEPVEYAGGGDLFFQSRIFSYSTFLEKHSTFDDSENRSTPDAIIAHLSELGYLQNEEKLRNYFITMYGSVI